MEGGQFYKSGPTIHVSSISETGTIIQVYKRGFLILDTEGKVLTENIIDDDVDVDYISCSVAGSYILLCKTSYDTIIFKWDSDGLSEVRRFTDGNISMSALYLDINGKSLPICAKSFDAIETSKRSVVAKEKEMNHVEIVGDEDDLYGDEYADLYGANDDFVMENVEPERDFEDAKELKSVVWCFVWTIEGKFSVPRN